MGLLASLVTCMVPLLKEEKREKLIGLLSEGKRRYLKVSLITILIGLALLPFLKQLTSWPEQSQTDLIITFSFFICTSLLIPSNLYRGYLEASNRGHLVHFINFIQSIFFTFFALIFAYWGWKIKAQGIAILFSGILGAFLLRYFSDIKIKLLKKNPEFDKQISKIQKPQVLNELAGKLCFNIDQIIIGFFLGPVVVTKVFLGQRVVLIMQQQLLSLGQSSWASLSTLYYHNEKNDGVFEKRLMEMTKVLAVFAVAGLVPICILNHAFIELWVGESYLMEDNSLVYLASTNAFFFGLYSFWGLIFTVLGKAEAITKLYWAQAIVNVVASIVGVKLFGGIGPIFGTLVSNLLIPLWYYPILLKRHFRLNEMKLVTAFIWPLMVGIGMQSIYHFGPWKFTHLSWASFIASAILIFSFHSLFLFFVTFNKEEKELFINRLIKLIKRG